MIKIPMDKQPSCSDWCFFARHNFSTLVMKCLLHEIIDVPTDTSTWRKHFAPIITILHILQQHWRNWGCLKKKKKRAQTLGKFEFVLNISFSAQERFLWNFNSLRPCDAIWRHRSGSTLAQVMACCLTGRHQAITWTNVDLSLVRSSGIHLRAISWDIPQPPFAKVSLKITDLKLIWNLPGPMS